jgi:hypothetical protein
VRQIVEEESAREWLRRHQPMGLRDLKRSLEPLGFKELDRGRPDKITLHKNYWLPGGSADFWLCSAGQWQIKAWLAANSIFIEHAYIGAMSKEVIEAAVEFDQRLSALKDHGLKSLKASAAVVFKEIFAPLNAKAFGPGTK